MEQFNYKKWNILLGWILFLTALVVYTLTVEPTVSFWDSGEYISTSAKLQVGHPPGAPLYQLVGAFFAMFASGPENIAFMVNMVSVLASAFTILFMFWSSTLLLKNLNALKNTHKQNSIAVLGSAATGCLTFIFTDSFWFNATEAEVYAMASLFIAMLFWAGLRWGEAMHTPNGNRWLLLIAMLTGLSFGVHFLALLTIPSIGLIYYFKNYQTRTFKNFAVANIAVIGILLFVFMMLLPYSMALFAKAEIFAVNSMGLPFNSGTVLMFLTVGLLFWYALRYTRKKQLPLYNTLVLCLLFVFIGFSSWMMLPVRANSGITINEKPPTDAADLLAYYNREQYPEQKVFYGPMYTQAYAGLDADMPYTDGKPNYERDYKTGKYVIINNYKNAKQQFDRSHEGFLPRLSKEKHAANYMAYAGAPDFRVNPNYDFESELPYYGINVAELSSEDTAIAAAGLRNELDNIIQEFKTAYRKGDAGNEELDSFLKNYSRYLIIDKPTLMQNISYMFSYQFGYMYWRYFMWNFAGRQNDIQGKADILNGNWISGVKAIDGLRLGNQEKLAPDMLNNEGRNTYFFIPLLLGAIGLLYHARKDAKSFYVLLVLFLFYSLAIKVFLNESPFEVRERDYVLVGSFYVFAIWIGFGVFTLLQFAAKFLKPKVAIPAVFAVTLLCCPVLMARENWDDHDRSGRYTALAMAKACLDSCAPNAILYTVGDNDTFPLWYAQEIENYRTDIRVVCTTYLPADWYIDQMKRQAYDSTPLPITLLHDQYRDGTRDFMLYNKKTDDRMSLASFMEFVSLDDERATVELQNGHRVNYYPSNKIRIPVNKEAVVKNKAVPQAYYDDIVPYIDIDLPDVLYKHNLIMLDIINNNNWERPIYFTGGSPEEDYFAWMDNYLQLEGMAYRLVPVKTENPEDNPFELGRVHSEKMYDTVMKWDWGNSNNPDVYLDPQTLRTGVSYKANLARLSDTLIEEGNPEKAEKIIDLALEKMPVARYRSYFMDKDFADGYYRTGNMTKARNLLTTLVQKYRENLTYYKSLKASLQDELYYTIIRDIESYRSLLLIMKENNDLSLYEEHKEEFNRYNKMFGRFGRKNE
ncbi:DUF2723 domain-containing protein [Flavobacterium coralii]|uniref:glycosyltransferase family 117 protein n=1 Tax=Flavobacterium coralii TaxID=2838017 RepID=UPI0032B1C4BC